MFRHFKLNQFKDLQTLFSGKRHFSSEANHVSHQSLINKTINAEYFIDKNGICNPIAYLGLNAMLCEETNEFNNRLKQIATQEDLKKCQNFFETIYIIKESSTLKHLFKNPLHASEAKLDHLFQLIMSKKVEEQGGIVSAGKFTTIYSNEDCGILIESLKQVKQRHKFNFPFGLLYRSIDHVNAFSAPDQFQLIDANYLPTFETDDLPLMAEHLYDSFVFDPVTPSPFSSKIGLGAELYVTKKNYHAANYLIREWLATKGMQHLLTITKEKAQATQLANGTTLLAIAASVGDRKTVKQCLDNGADPNAMTSTFVTPLFYAAGNGETEIMKDLLAHGANSNLRCTEDEIPPLHTAIISGNQKSVRILLEARADVDLANKYGTAAHTVALQHHQSAIMNLLIQFGNQTNAPRLFSQQSPRLFSQSTATASDYCVVDNPKPTGNNAPFAK